ncbi:universal stress protein [Thermodesulfobacteriota bacterium]
MGSPIITSEPPEQLQKILLTVDLSEASSQLVPYVTTMAEKFESEIHLLFVARLLQHFTSIYVPHASIDNFEKELVDGAEKKLLEFEEEYFGSFSNIKTTVVIGSIAEEILDYIQSEGIDLLIMGTHGRQGLDKIIFGSVADRVIKSVPIPVLLVNPFTPK